MKTFYSAVKRNFGRSHKSADFFSHNFETSIHFRDSFNKFKMFRVMDNEGGILNKEYENIPKETALRIFTTMVQIRECDTRYLMAQREGKISFYMTCSGEEASTTASAAALSDEDMIFPQYREAAALLYRGFTIQELANQLTGNELDRGKGRQMPIHYGSRRFNYQTVSSPLCTQVPQASGTGYLYRTQNKDRIAVTYFGDGAASEGDFHPALNFAATLRSQTLFFCRNNMYAISTPIDDQYHGDGIAVRGPAYGIHTIRVDGNDVFAVYNAVKAARELIVSKQCPVLIEAMAYREGDHSTSDFSKMYRHDGEMEKWKEYLISIGSPVDRFFKYLNNKGWTNEEEYKSLIEKSKVEVRESLKTALTFKKPGLEALFTDVYEEIPVSLKEQKRQLVNHIAKYPEVYQMDNFADK